MIRNDVIIDEFNWRPNLLLLYFSNMRNHEEKLVRCFLFIPFIKIFGHLLSYSFSTNMELKVVLCLKEWRDRWTSRNFSLHKIVSTVPSPSFKKTIIRPKRMFFMCWRLYTFQMQVKHAAYPSPASRRLGFWPHSTNSNCNLILRWRWARSDQDRPPYETYLYSLFPEILLLHTLRYYLLITKQYCIEYRPFYISTLEPS